VAVQRLSNSGRSGFSYKSLIAGITPLPSVPTIGTANVVSSTSVNVVFTTPGAYAGSTYTATSSPGGLTGTSASSPILVEGLSDETEYTFTVTATNATGTSGASAASSPVTTPSGDTGVMYPISIINVDSSTAASVTFSSIPSTYTHLQLRIMAKVTRSTYPIGELSAQFNSDSGSNYSVHELYGDGSTVTAIGGTSGTSMRWGNGTIGTTTGEQFGVMIADILDYANTSKYKTVRNISGTDCNGTVNSYGGRVGIFSNLWMSTSAINSIYITYGGGQSNFTQYTTFALYGIKGA